MVAEPRAASRAAQAWLSARAVRLIGVSCRAGTAVEVPMPYPPVADLHGPGTVPVTPRQRNQAADEHACVTL